MTNTKEQSEELCQPKTSHMPVREAEEKSRGALTGPSTINYGSTLIGSRTDHRKKRALTNSKAKEKCAHLLIASLLYILTENDVSGSGPDRILVPDPSRTFFQEPVPPRKFKMIRYRVISISFLQQKNTAWDEKCSE